MRWRGRIARVATAAFIGGMVSSQALASGFQLQEQTASGLGVAFSGMAAATQDAGTVFWNPAGMSFLPGTALSAAANYIAPSARFNSSGPPPAGSTYTVFGNGGEGGVSAVVPAIYGKYSITPDLAVGLAVNTPFGLSTEWESQWAGMFYAVKSRVETLNFNPVVSYKVNDLLSVGAGVSYERLKATLTRGVTPLIPSAQSRLDGSDWAWGWNLGALLDFGQGTRVGLTYRSSIGYTIDGTLSFNSPALTALGGSARTALRLPRTVSVGVSHQLRSNLRLLADFTSTGWNSISNLTIVSASGPAAGRPVANEALNFKNSWRLGAGVEYKLQGPWTLRGGVAYDRTPVQDAFRTPRLPDNDRKWLSAGARYSPDPQWSVDVGYAHLWVPDSPSQLTSAGPVPGNLLGTYRADINIVALQASFQF